MFLLNKKQSYYGFIDGPVKEDLKIIFVDAKTEKGVPELSFAVKEKYKSIKEFIEDIPKIFGKNFKALILNVFYFDTPEFLNNYEFCEAIKFQLDSIKIPYIFATNSDIKFTSLFASINITVNIDDTVIMVFTENDKYCIGEYQFTKNGYIEICSYFVNANQKPENIRNEILRSAKPVKIIGTTLFSDEKNQKLLLDLKNIMQKSDGLVFGDSKSTWCQGIVEISKWILDNKYVKFHFLLKGKRRYYLVGKVGDKSVPDYLGGSNGGLLPYETTQNILKSNMEYSLAYTDFHHPERVYLQPIKLCKNCHRTKFTIKVDINAFYTCQVEPIIYEGIEAFKDAFTSMEMPKIPVIVFIDNLSIIYVYKNDKYEFIDEWNGLEGNELLISFADEKPKFCKEAIDDSKIKPASVVFDLIQIMSMPIDKIEPELHWNFSFTKDSENPILIEFENFDGTKMAASPAFLMAMLLKEHLKVIKNATGKKKKPKQIAFLCFNNRNDEEMSRIMDGLKDACKMLKIECNFIEGEL